MPWRLTPEVVFRAIVALFAVHRTLIDAIDANLI
jgi:hypothetical protein